MRREEIAKIDGCIGCHRAPNECKGPGDCRLKNVVEILETALGNKYAEESMHDLTDRILATERTGVEAVKECDYCDGNGHEHQAKCGECDGTGLIRRELTKDEVNEFAIEAIKYIDETFSTDSKHESKLSTITLNGSVYFKLPSGERLEVKEGV